MNEYRHDDGAVLRLYPQPDGARMVFEDEKGNICLFNPVNDQVRGFLAFLLIADHRITRRTHQSMCIGSLFCLTHVSECGVPFTDQLPDTDLYHQRPFDCLAVA